MINTADLTDAELVVLWHRVNCNSYQFWEGYGRADGARPKVRRLEEALQSDMWAALDAEVGVRGIDPYNCTKETIITTTKTEAL